MTFSVFAKIKDFEEAKKFAQVIWQEHRETFYCGCKYNKHGIIDFSSCSYTPNDPRKSRRIGWEHVVPASWYGKQLACWREPLCVSQKGKKYKGRNCCRKINPEFRAMEADLHNLVPVIREVNTARSNFQFVEYYPESKDQKYNFNHCKIIFNEHYRVYEPRDEVKGMVARISLFMADKYGIDLGKRQRKLLTDWNKRFPPNAWEKIKNQKVAAIQGDMNGYIQ